MNKQKEQIDADGFNHINTELTEAEVSEIADRQPKFVVCKVATENNINLELLDLLPIDTSEEMEKLEALCYLKRSLWLPDNAIKRMASRYGLLDMIGWKLNY